MLLALEFQMRKYNNENGAVEAKHPPFAFKQVPKKKKEKRKNKALGFVYYHHLFHSCSATRNLKTVEGRIYIQDCKKVQLNLHKEKLFQNLKERNLLQIRGAQCVAEPTP